MTHAQLGRLERLKAFLTIEALTPSMLLFQEDAPYYSNQS